MFAENGGGTFTVFLLYLCVWKAGGSTEGCPDIVLRSPHFAKVHNSTCYVFVNQELYWNEARSACWCMGGEMLSIRNQNTMQFISTVLSSRQLYWFREGVWLGARYSMAQWRWTTGTMLDYSNWAQGQPSLILGLFSLEDCALMRRSDNWQWHDYPCGSLKFHYNYICEFPFSSVGGYEAHTEYTRDNGNFMLLTIMLISGGVVLLILLVVFLVVRHWYNYRKLASDPDVHFDNRRYNLADCQPAGAQVSRPSTHPTSAPTSLTTSGSPSSSLEQARLEGSGSQKGSSIAVCLLKDCTSPVAESASTSLSCSDHDRDLGASRGPDSGDRKALVASEKCPSLSAAGATEQRDSAGKMAESISGQQRTGRRSSGDYLFMNGHPLSSVHSRQAVSTVNKVAEEEGAGGGDGDGSKQPGAAEEEESQPSIAASYSDPGALCRSSSNLWETFPHISSLL